MTASIDTGSVLNSARVQQGRNFCSGMGSDEIETEIRQIRFGDRPGQWEADQMNAAGVLCYKGVADYQRFRRNRCPCRVEGAAPRAPYQKTELEFWDFNLGILERSKDEAKSRKFTTPIGMVATSCRRKTEGYQRRICNSAEMRCRVTLRGEYCKPERIYEY